jgi:hypothetical protein
VALAQPRVVEKLRVAQQLEQLDLVDHIVDALAAPFLAATLDLMLQD